MEAIMQTLASMGPLKILGGIAFIILVIAVIKAMGSKNNMPGGGSGSPKGGTGTTGTGTNNQPPQNPQ